MPSKSVQDGGMLLADEWKLFPVDERNWELCHLYATTSGKEAGVVKWHRCRRFYSYNTIDQAMLYVLDVLAKQGATDQMLALASALRQWQDGVERLERAARSWSM